MITLLASSLILSFSIFFYYKKTAPIPFLKIASLHSTLSWTFIVLFLFRFFKELNLLSPYEEIIYLILGMSGFQLLVWIVAHGFERFYYKK